MTVYRDNYPNNIEAPQKLYIQYSHDISFDYSTGRYPDGTESEWHWESNYIPIAHKINGLDVGRHEWMKIRIGETNFWTYPIRMSANITNIQTIESEIDEGTGEFSFTIKLTFEDGSTKESNPITIKNGVDGVEITSAQINETGYLIITYSDGTVENAGRARGEDAEGLPVGPDGYILSTTGGGIPVWILPLQVVNAAISTNAPLSYNITNGQFTISQATTTTDGYLSSTDWNAFNDKIDNTHPANSITNTDITNLGNLSGTNTGDQVGDGVTITGSGTALDPFVAEIPEIVPDTYQTLISASSVTMDVEVSVNAKITLSHNVTLTLDNLVNGSEGNIEVIQGTPDHTLTIIPTPYVLNDGGSTIELLSGVGNITVVSYSYDGATLLVTYNKLQEPPITDETDPIFSQWLTDTPPAYPGDIPTALSELSEDTTHRTVTDTEKSAWNSYKEVINCYIVGSTPLASDWLSLTVGGAALTPEIEKIYIVLTSGEYENFQYRWTGSAYVNIGGVPSSNAASVTSIATDNILTTNLQADKAEIDKLVLGFTSTATAAGTTTLDINSTYHQYFTGNTTQTIVMPVVSTLTLGRKFHFFNQSTGIVTINSSGGNRIMYLAPRYGVIIQCISLSGTDASSWQIVANTETITFHASDLTTACTVGTNKEIFFAQFAFETYFIWAGLATQCTGSTFIIDINNGGNSMLDTKLTIDASEDTSLTAATAHVLNSTYKYVTKGAKIAIDFDQVGATIAGAGVVINMEVIRT